MNEWSRTRGLFMGTCRRRRGTSQKKISRNYIDGGALGLQDRTCNNEGTTPVLGVTHESMISADTKIKGPLTNPQSVLDCDTR